jgi:PTS system mannitol-specific IIC component
MLVNNYTAGILGAVLSILCLVGIGPIFVAFSDAMGSAVQGIINQGLLPLASLVIEPAKILFLNNAINHGILGPLGIAEAASKGQSIFFLLEANPGPGLGVLLACWFFGKGLVKESAPGAIIIHFFGGIHEIYFPYVLMNPLLLLSVIAGGMTGVMTFVLLGAGLVAATSPGSIFSITAMAPKGGLLPVYAGVLTAAVVSFLISAVIMRAKGLSGDLETAKGQVKEMKGLRQVSIKKIVFACDAGMGSSAMGASTLRKKIKAANLDIEVTHSAIEDIPADANLIVTHESLGERTRQDHPGVEVVTITNFVGAPEYDTLVQRLVK